LTFQFGIWAHPRLRRGPGFAGLRGSRSGPACGAAKPLQSLARPSGSPEMRPVYQPFGPPKPCPPAGIPGRARPRVPRRGGCIGPSTLILYCGIYRASHRAAWMPKTRSPVRALPWVPRSGGRLPTVNKLKETYPAEKDQTCPGNFAASRLINLKRLITSGHVKVS
jgi:hypothetical protein